MKKIIGLIIVCTIIISGMLIYKKSDEKTFTNDNGAIIAAIIDGEESTSFPTTSDYAAKVTCTKNGKSVDVGATITWSSNKWVLAVSDVSSSNIRCKVSFSSPTLANMILANNEVKTPLTVPGQGVSGYTIDDVTQTGTISVSNTYRNYYWTYGTGWVANGNNKFDLTGATVTDSAYSNSYSSLVGKYLVSYLEYNNAASTKTMKTTIGLNAVYYVISATSTSITYKKLLSNAGKSEALLASTPDDYGTSYYFRGNVKNNFVKFANMCWRVVRITGDGAVKLVLYNYNGLTDSSTSVKTTNPCSISYSASNAYARYSGTTYTTAFNSSSVNDNAFVGFMYGKTGASNYADTHANNNKSTILTNLEKWYTNVLSKQSGFSSDKLADVIWCNDKSTYSGLGYGSSASTQTIYGTYGRHQGKSISLVCPNDNNGGKLSKFTADDTKYGNGALDYKIGLLTFEEMLFAGYGFVSSSIHSYTEEPYYYLTAGEEYWWTMSPMYSSSMYVDDFMDGDNANGDIGDYAVALRPSIAIAKNVAVTGTGTSSDPYVIN